MHTSIKELSQSLGKLNKLKYLGLNGTKIDHIPKVIGKLKNLTEFYQGQTDVKVLPIEMKELTKLERLALWETQLEVLPDWVCSYANLKGLYLGRDEKLQMLHENIGNLLKLEDLYLDGTGLSELPESFGELSTLKELQMHNTNVNRFPVLSIMENLESCNLSNMVLERIPKEFINSKMEIILNDGYARG